MSAKTETIRVRISPGVRVWQVLLVAVMVGASLWLGLVLGREGAPSSTENTTSRDLTPCASHIAEPGCELPVAGTEHEFIYTPHIPRRNG
jgi:hypothetical protein